MSDRPDLEHLEHYGPVFPMNRLCGVHEAIYKEKVFQVFQVFQNEAISILNHCRLLGLDLWEDDGLLRYRGPAEVVTPELIAMISAHKAEFLPLLNPPNWDRLSAQRWGPSVGDPDPGIVVHSPDPIRRLIAYQTAENDFFVDPTDLINSAGFVL